ncbi:MAG: hypothetical protein ACM3SY_07500 [Candidatus Omnitrophota bacterium]
MSESLTELKQLICGDNFCDNRSGWQKFADNFITTNAAIPGIVAPWGSGLLTGNLFASYMDSITLFQWAFNYHFSGVVMGGAMFSSLELELLPE